jgi:hypothetical protein
MNTFLIKYNYTSFKNKEVKKKELENKLQEIKNICNKYLIIDYNYKIANEILNIIMS